MAVIGLALGSRNYTLALALYSIALGSLWLLSYLEPLLPRQTFRQIVVRMQGDGMPMEEVTRYFGRYRLNLERVAIEKNKQAQTTNYTFVLRGKKSSAFVEAFNDLLQRDDVQYGQLMQQEQLGLDETETLEDN